MAGAEVYCTSVTEQWATIAISGPDSRKLSAELAEGIDVGPEAFAHMSMREAARRAGVFGISFTGGFPGFEIQVPASYGLVVWEVRIEAGAKYGITPFGTEAMHVLRAEKGYIIAGRPLDGMVTPHDLGMDWIVAQKKADFIARSLARADVQKPGQQLVGLLPELANELLEEGAQIVADPHQSIPMAMIGHVTSSYVSPNLGRSFALAPIRTARAHGRAAVRADARSHRRRDGDRAGVPRQGGDRLRA